jgi:hypothetical protein
MITFKDWLKQIEAIIVFGNSQKKRDLGDDACIWGAPGVQHGRSLGPITKKKRRKKK